MRDVEQAIRDLLDAHNAWRDAAQSATPGGSEYTTPESCREYIRTVKEELYFARCEIVRLHRAAKRESVET